MILFITLFIMSCGEQYHAKNTIDRFLNVYLQNDKISLVSISSLDSTWHLTDSVITVLQQNAKKNPLFRKQIIFHNRTSSDKKLILTRAILEPTESKDKKVVQVFTFYLTPDLKKVVAVKEN